MRIATDDSLKQILQTQKRILVVGLSPDANRPSFGVTQYMINAGYEIYGLRPGGIKQILDRPVFENLRDVSVPIDIVDVFRSAEAVGPLVDEIGEWMKSQKEKPKTLWLQEGIANPKAEASAERLGLAVVAGRCILKDHARLM